MSEVPLRKVYVPNKGSHDLSAAEKFGELIFITESYVNRYAVGTVVRAVEQQMQDASADDYILVTGLPVLNMIAAAVFAHKFGRLNLLLHKQQTGEYIVREMLL